MNKEKLEARRLAKKQAEQEKKIESEKNQKEVSEITINIEWKRSQMWGANPNCEATVKFKDGTYHHSPIFKCSGCGYDKESTVIADVFNHYLKYKLYAIERIQKEKPEAYQIVYGKSPYGIYFNDYKRYSGGIGANCYYKISEYIGGKFEHVSGGRSFDVYKYTDN